MIDAIIRYNYMQNAVLAALLASLICGIIGTIIVEKKLVSMSGGIAHASFGGIGAGYYFSIEPIIGGVIVAVLTSISVAVIKRKQNVHADTIISMFWSSGMAIGILFIALTPGYPPDMTSYLFGDILTVNQTYIFIMSVLAVMILLVILLLFNYFKLYLFDEEYARVLGIHVRVLENVLYVIIALSIVILIKVVGIILALAMLTIPTAIAKYFTYDLNVLMRLSVILSCIFSLVGLTLSYYINIPSGSTIILVAMISYFIIFIWNRFRNKVAKMAS